MRYRVEGLATRWEEVGAVLDAVGDAGEMAELVRGLEVVGIVSAAVGASGRPVSAAGGLWGAGPFS